MKECNWHKNTGVWVTKAYVGFTMFAGYFSVVSLSFKQSQGFPWVENICWVESRHFEIRWFYGH